MPSTTRPTGIETPNAIFVEVERPEVDVACGVAPGVLLGGKLVEVTNDEMTDDVPDCTEVRDAVTLETMGENSSNAPASSCC